MNGGNVKYIPSDYDEICLHYFLHESGIIDHITANIDYTRKWYLIQQQPLLNQILKEPPIISCRKGHSLKDILVRAKI